jgi:hypothetical protein
MTVTHKSESWRAMATKNLTRSAGGEAVFAVGKAPEEVMIALQRDLLESYERAGIAWLSRIKAEVNLWSELADKLSSNPPIHNAIEAYSTSAARRMQMIVEDGKTLVDNGQDLTQRILRSLGAERAVEH